MKRGSWGAGETGGVTVLSVSPRVGSREKNLLDVFLTDVVPANASLRKIRAGRYVRAAGRKVGIDITWVTDRIAVGGGIWNADNMAAAARAGITHIIDMQIEFDDTPLAVPFGISVCWNPVDDDFEPKPAAVFKRGVDFALAALKQDGTKLFVHCAAGVHRAPMMALALLGVQGWTVEDAMELIEGKRPVADFADVYVQSVERFLSGRG
jgi:hypothetical protein